MNSIVNTHNSHAVHGKKPVSKGIGPEADGDATGMPGEFSGLFAALMNGKAGQVFAAGEGKASPEANELAAETLSPSVNIITASTPALNDESLQAFARSQGMDEAAMALIFQGKASAAAPLAAVSADLSTSVPAISPDLSVALSADMAPTASAEASGPGSGLNGTPGANAIMMAALELGEEASMRWTIGTPAKETAAPEPAPVLPPLVTTELLKPMMFGLNGLRTAAKPETHNGTAAEAEAQAEADQSGDLPGKSLAASLMQAAPEAAQQAKRQAEKLSLTRGSDSPANKSMLADISTKLSLNPVATQAASASMGAAAQTDTRIETLILGENLSGEELQAVFAQRAESGAQGQGQPNGQGGNSAAAAAQTDIDLRAEQYEKLSHRLAEALGQRLSAQIARGEWKVELALKPHNLGTVDIQLTMKNGALEASFNASEASTRELINDGMPKLKEVLEKSGMELAVLDVNVRQNSQNGGNPTPGRQPSSGQGLSAVKGDTEKTGPAAKPAATGKQTGNQDGLDVLV